ncbi:unnamed protein product [Rhizopus stolonifer]
MKSLRAPARDPKEVQILSEHPVLRKTLPPDRSSNASRWRTDDLELKPDPFVAKRKRRGSNRSFTSMNSAENDRPPLHSWNKPLSENNQNVVTSPLEWDDLKEEEEAKDYKKTDCQSAFQTDSGWCDRNLEEVKLSVLWEASDEKAGQEGSSRTENNAPFIETNAQCPSNIREETACLYDQFKVDSSALSNSWVTPVGVSKQQVTLIQPPADSNSWGNTSVNEPSGPSTNVATDSFVNESNDAKSLVATNSWENPSVNEPSKPSTNVDVNSWGGPFVKEPNNAEHSANVPSESNKTTANDVWDAPSADKQSNSRPLTDIDSWSGPFVKEPSNPSLSTSTDSYDVPSAYETRKPNQMIAPNAPNNTKTLMGRDAFRNKPKVHRNMDQDAVYDAPPSLATVGRITEGDGWGNPSGDPAEAHGGWEDCYPDDEEKKNRSRTRIDGSKGSSSRGKSSGTQGSLIDLLQPPSVLFEPLPVKATSSNCQKKIPPYNQKMDHSQLTTVLEKAIPHQEIASNQIHVDYGVNSTQFSKTQIHKIQAHVNQEHEKQYYEKKEQKKQAKQTQAHETQGDSIINFTDFMKDIRVLICQPKTEVAKGVYQRVPIYMDSSIIQIVEDLNNEHTMEMGNLFKARLSMAFMKEAVLSHYKVNRSELL